MGKILPFPLSNRDQMEAVTRSQEATIINTSNIKQEWQPRGLDPQGLVAMNTELGTSRGKVNLYYNQEKPKWRIRSLRMPTPTPKSLSFVQCRDPSHS